MLSICTTIKNRSRVKSDKGTLNLFPNCIKSIANSLHVGEMDDVEMVISDWKSTDWAIKEWIEDVLPHINIHIVNIEGTGFSAGAGRNVAARASRGDILLFLDADMTVNERVIKEGWEGAKNGNIVYPRVIYKIEDNKEFLHEGGGNMFMPKDVYEKSGGWPEYWKHGFEDTDFHKQLQGIAPIIAGKSTMFHQWHPQTKLFKDIHSNGDPVVDQRKEHYQQQETVQPSHWATAIDRMLNNDPNITHNTLNKPVKGEDRRLL